MQVTGSFSKQVCPYTLEPLRDCQDRRSLQNCAFSLERCASSRLFIQAHEVRPEDNCRFCAGEEKVLKRA